LTEPGFSPTQHAAFRLSQTAVLHDIRMFGCESAHISFPQSGELSVNVELTPRFEQIDDASVVFWLGVRVDVSGPVPFEANKVVDLNVEYGALYQFPGVENIRDEELVAFGGAVASMTMWPYCRSQVQSLSLAMGIPAVTLPVLRPDLVVGVASSGEANDADALTTSG